MRIPWAIVPWGQRWGRPKTAPRITCRVLLHTRCVQHTSDVIILLNITATKGRRNYYLHFPDEQEVAPGSETGPSVTPPQGVGRVPGAGELGVFGTQGGLKGAEARGKGPS